MKVIVVHNSYIHSGGEDSVVRNEKSALQKNGVKVHSFTAHNASLNNPWKRVKALIEVNYSRTYKKKMIDCIAECKPDIVHVHNTFPLLTPSIYDACEEMGIPVVKTLHNYRLICPTSTLMHNGKICERSVGRAVWWAVPRRVYRGSLLGTFILANLIETQKRRGTWEKKISRFIVLSDFAKHKFVEAGLPENKIVVKPNFYEDSDIPDTKKHPKRFGALFVGRLSREKGADAIAESWRNVDYPLTVAGEGPLLETIISFNNPSIRMLGHLSPPKVNAEMRKSLFLVMGSICYEMCPMVLIEAFAHGLPAVVPRHGALSEMVINGVTGLHYEKDDAEDFVKKAKWAISNPSQMRELGRNARSVYKVRYSAEDGVKKLLRIYRDVIDEATAC